MRSLIGAVLICLSAAAGSATAQDNVLSDSTRMMYGVMSQQMLLASAEKMPEEAYAFKPTDAVRTYGQIVGHIADMQYLFCSVALGEKNPAPRVEQTRTSKTDLITALKHAIAYCDRAYGSMTDASALGLVKMGAGEMPRVSVLNTNMTQSAETRMQPEWHQPKAGRPEFGVRDGVTGHRDVWPPATQPSSANANTSQESM